MLGEKRTFIPKIGNIIRANFLGKERLVLLLSVRSGIVYQRVIFIDLERQEIFETSYSQELSPDCFYESVKILSSCYMPYTFQVRFLGIEC